MKPRFLYIAACLLVGALPACVPNPGTEKVFGYAVINTYPHDSQAFTQGLLYSGGLFFESTGQYGQSELRQVALETGAVLRSVDLPGGLFGEGLVRVGDRLIQLTWREGKARVHAVDTFELVHEFDYTGEGWGLTYDGQRLIMSDGSAMLTFRDPDTFEVTGQVTVMDSRGLVNNLNELEYIDGRVYANVYGTNRVVIIDPATGNVTAWIDLSGLLTPLERVTANVLNGIAHDAENDRLFVTGKYWPKLFEIELVEVN